MRRLIALTAILLLAGLLFWMAIRTPSPTDGPGAFSARRAQGDVAVIAATAHPLGSPANQAVRDHLVRRLGHVGFQAHVLRARAWMADPGGAFLSVGTPETVVGLLPGRDRTAPALGIMAHYDSVPGSPGGGDDAAGVAAALEIARLIQTRGTPARDVVLILTDGEEAGLLGARAFFRRDPLAGRLGFVVNMDVRGSAGRTMMYETGAAPAGAVELFARVSPSPRAVSLFPFVYRRLPYGTDFTLVRETGISGLNFSFLAGEFDYHSPSALASRLNPGALADLGAQAAAVSLAVAYAPALPAAGPEPVYADVLGLGLIRYPAWAGWLVILLAAGVLALALVYRGGGAIRLLDLLCGAGAGLYALALAGALMTLAAAAGSAGYLRLGLTARLPAFEAAAFLLGLGALLIAAAASAWGRRWWVFALLGAGAGLSSSLFTGFDLLGAGLGLTAAVSAMAFFRPAAARTAWAGLLMLGLAAAVAAQAAAPEAAPVIAWPVLAGAVILALTAPGRALPLRLLAAGVFTAIALAWVIVLGHLSLQALDMPAMGGLSALLGLMLLWGWLAADPPRLAVRAGAGLLALSFVGVAVLALIPPWSARTPRPVGIFHLTEGAGAWRATQRPVDDWTRRALSPLGQAVETRDVAGLGRIRAARAEPAPPTAPPRMSVGRIAGGRLVLRVEAAPEADLLVLTTDGPTPLRGLLIEGSPVRLLSGAGRPGRIAWQAPDGAPLELTFDGPPSGRIDAGYVLYRSGWPPGHAPLPALPPDRMAMGRSGSSVTVGRMTAQW